VVRAASAPERLSKRKENLDQPHLIFLQTAESRKITRSRNFPHFPGSKDQIEQKTAE
jgi:hypothetical protein